MASFAPLMLSYTVALAGWIVALAGIASLQAITVEFTAPDGTQVKVPLPNWRLSMEWFVWSMQTMMLVLVVVVVFMRKLRATRAAINSNLCFCSVLWAVFANHFYQLVRGIESTGWYSDLLNVGYQPTHRYTTMIAGACLLVAGNFCIMFACDVYYEDEGAREAAQAPVKATAAE